MLVNAYYLIIYPEYTPLWFIRLISLGFIFEATNYFLEFSANKINR
jgi:hypothetical protein